MSSFMYFKGGRISLYSETSAKGHSEYETTTNILWSPIYSVFPLYIKQWNFYMLYWVFLRSIIIIIANCDPECGVYMCNYDFQEIDQVQETLQLEMKARVELEMDIKNLSKRIIEKPSGTQ